MHLQLRVHANQFEKRKAMEREGARRAAKKAAEMTRPDGGNQRPQLPTQSRCGEDFRQSQRDSRRSTRMPAAGPLPKVPFGDLEEKMSDRMSMTVPSRAHHERRSFMMDGFDDHESRDRPKPPLPQHGRERVRAPQLPHRARQLPQVVLR